MKKLLAILVILFVSIATFGQEVNYKEYSYTAFFKMIEKEKDSIFKLKDALIKYNINTDERFKINNFNVYEKKDSSYVYQNDIVINKSIELENVQFLTTQYRTDKGLVGGGVLVDILFKKPVTLNNTTTLTMRYCRFNKKLNINSRDCNVNKYVSDITDSGVDIAYSDFSDFESYILCPTGSSAFLVSLMDNRFTSKGNNDRFLFSNSGIKNLRLEGNYIEYENAAFVGLFESNFTKITKNRFISPYIQQNINSINTLHWSDNKYSSTIFITPIPFSSDDIIDFEQFKNGISAYSGLMNYSLTATSMYPVHLTQERNKVIIKYLDSVRIYNEKAFSEEMSLKSQFYSHFKSKYNTRIANKVYIDLKDFETQRLKIEHDQNPGFRPYFKWKVNQFLKVFSDYGTEPSKAIVVSLYVILFFAFIYLFFPNTWDSHGKNRIIDRYSFFFKYMNKKAGIHEVYLDDQKEEIMQYNTFKTLIATSGQTVPKFFSATAMPMYKWAISGTKISALVLKRIDIMKGTWSDLPKSKRIWKSVLLVGAFLIAITYDIFIKMLNALMLSINTFTTLGFGEIPIKGLPRYLAIIQGFIGWFMLTIFSVSLISQLLN